MSIGIKMWEETDYPIIAGWYRARHLEPTPLEILPRMGALAMDGDRPIGCTWVFMANCKGLAFLSGLVTDPANNLSLSRKAIRAMLEFIEEELLKIGYTFIETYTENSAMAKEAEKMGYASQDRKYFRLGKVIG